MTFTNYQLVLNCKTYLRVRYRLVAPTLRFRYTMIEGRAGKEEIFSNLTPKNVNSTKKFEVDFS